MPKEGLLHYNLITIIMYFFCAWYQYNMYLLGLTRELEVSNSSFVNVRYFVCVCDVYFSPQCIFAVLNFIKSVNIYASHLGTIKKKISQKNVDFYFTCIPIS